MSDTTPIRQLLTEGEIERIAKGLREYVAMLERAITPAFMTGQAGVAKRVRAQITLLTLGADSIEQMLFTQLDQGLTPVVIQLKENASAVIHVHPIVAAELERLRQLDIFEEPGIDVQQLDIEDLLAQAKLEDQP